jgi:hypothetical protein
MAGVDMSMTPFDFSFYELLVELVRTGRFLSTALMKRLSVS